VFLKSPWLAHEKKFHERKKVFICCDTEYGRTYDFQVHHKKKHKECSGEPCYNNPPHQGKCTCKCTHAELYARDLPEKCAWGCPYCETCSATSSIHFSHIFENHYNIGIPSRRKTREDRSNSTMILSLLHQDFTAKAWKTLKKTKNCSGISWDHTGEDALLNLKRLLEETTHGGLSPAKLAIAAFNASDPSQAGASHAGFMMATDPAVNLSHAEQNTPGQERIISVEHQVAQLQDPTYAEPLGRELRDPPWDEELMPGPSHFPYRYEPISD
jgi:hypothetical protein